MNIKQLVQTFHDKEAIRSNDEPLVELMATALINMSLDTCNELKLLIKENIVMKP